MKLSNIRDILAVAEAGSLRAASRKIGITQPSISRSISDTEKELGILLFTRHGHGVALTEMGHRFVRRATAINSELRHIYEELEQEKGHFVGEVSIAMSTAASLALMPTVFSKFREQYPHALLKLTESLFQSVEADILAGRVDFFVGPFHEEMSSTSLRVEKLFENRRTIVGRKGHPLIGTTSLEGLRGARWIRPSFSYRRDESDFEAMFERAGLPPPEIVVHTRSIMMTLLALANSDLLTILPVQWLDFSLTSEPVETIPLLDGLQAAPVCIIWRGDLPLTPLAERLCDMVRKAGLNYGLTGSRAG